MGKLPRAGLEVCDSWAELTFTRYTMQEAKNSVEVLRKTMDRDYQGILSRVHALELQQVSQTNREIVSSEPTNMYGESENTATIPSVDDTSTKRFFSKFFNFLFEKDLSQTTVYKKIKFRRSNTSLCSVDMPATRWSTLSSLSVADVVSRISVLSLAITPAEVYKDSRYFVSSHDEPPVFQELPSVQTQNYSSDGLVHSRDLINKSFTSPESSLEQNLPRLYRGMTQIENPPVTDEPPTPPHPSLSRKRIPPPLDLGIIQYTKAPRNLDLGIAESKEPNIENFKSFRVSMEDCTDKVLPVALKKYNLNADWRSYSLYIVYDDQEHCFGLKEKPILIFKQLDREGKKPMFLLRKHRSVRSF